MHEHIETVLEADGFEQTVVRMLAPVGGQRILHHVHGLVLRVVGGGGDASCHFRSERKFPEGRGFSPPRKHTNLSIAFEAPEPRKSKRNLGKKRNP